MPAKKKSNKQSLVIPWPKNFGKAKEVKGELQKRATALVKELVQILPPIIAISIRNAAAANTDHTSISLNALADMLNTPRFVILQATDRITKDLRRQGYQAYVGFRYTKDGDKEELMIDW